MERVAKRRLTEHVAPLSLRHQQVAEDYFDRYRSSSQSSSGGGYLQKETNDTSAYSTCRQAASSKHVFNRWLDCRHESVASKKWGTGTVVRITGEGDRQELDVAFAGMGIKRLLASFAPIEKIEE